MSRSQRHMREAHNLDSYGHKFGISRLTDPTVSGNIASGQTLTGTNGTYQGRATLTITRQWLRDGVAIGGQTGATYVLAAGDVGKRVVFQNTVTDGLAKQTTQKFQSAPKGPITA